MSPLEVPDSTLKPTLDCSLPKTGAKPSMFCVLVSFSKGLMQCTHGLSFGFPVSKSMEIRLMSQLELDFRFQNGRESLAMGFSGLQKISVLSLWKD